MSVEKLELFITTSDLEGLDNLLLLEPALAKSRTSHQVSPLMLSCYYKKPAVTAVILKHLEDINLFEAAAAGRLDAVSYLVKNRPASLDYHAEDGFTPLGLACYFGHARIAEFLVSNGADVNLPSNNGFGVYPIHSACAGDFTEIAKVLIENNAMVNVRQQAGATPLHSAAQNGNIELLVLLLEHGADVGVRMEGGKLPADLARDKGFAEIAEALV